MKLPFLLFQAPEQFTAALRKYLRALEHTSRYPAAAVITNEYVIREFIECAQNWGYGERPTPPPADPVPTCRTCKGPILTGQDYTCEHGPHHGNHSDCIAHLVEALSKLKKPEPAE
jgi:hypothetical protein